MMDKQFFLQLLGMFLDRIVPLIILLVLYLIRKALKKNNASAEQAAFVEGAFDILARAARNTNQVWVEALKKANGTLSDEEKAKARQDTTDIFKQMLTEGMKYALEQAYGSVDKYVELNLESAVNSVKDNKKE